MSILKKNNYRGIIINRNKNILKPVSNIIKICAKDELKNVKTVHDGYAIINTNKSGGKGEHWVCIHIKNGSCTYFDSFGVKVLDMEMLDYIKKNVAWMNISTQCVKFKVWEAHFVGSLCVHLYYQHTRLYIFKILRVIFHYMI